MYIVWWKMLSWDPYLPPWVFEPFTARARTTLATQCSSTSAPPWAQMRAAKRSPCDTVLGLSDVFEKTTTGYTSDWMASPHILVVSGALYAPLAFRKVPVLHNVDLGAPPRSMHRVAAIEILQNHVLLSTSKLQGRQLLETYSKWDWRDVTESSGCKTIGFGLHTSQAVSCSCQKKAAQMISRDIPDLICWTQILAFIYNIYIYINIYHPALQPFRTKEASTSPEILTLAKSLIPFACSDCCGSTKETSLKMMRYADLRALRRRLRRAEPPPKKRPWEITDFLVGFEWENPLEMGTSTRKWF